jgi:hypothetical protein
MIERSALNSVLGLPGYAAIAIALGFTALGVFIDLSRINGLGAVFKGCYFTGCVLAVCWVKRRALFGPMVQPPLLLAVAVPSVVLISGEGVAGTGGAADHLLSIGAPLLNGFPTMAVTTTFAVGIGAIRYVTQRPLEPEERPWPGGRSSAPQRSGRSGNDPIGGRPRGERAGADWRGDDRGGDGRPRGERAGADWRGDDRGGDGRPGGERAGADWRGDDRGGDGRPSGERAGAGRLGGQWAGAGRIGDLARTDGDRTGDLARTDGDRTEGLARTIGDRIGGGRPTGGGSPDRPGKEQRRDAQRRIGERPTERTRPLRGGSASAAPGRGGAGESSAVPRPEPPSPPGVPDPPWRRVGDPG